MVVLHFVFSDVVVAIPETPPFPCLDYTGKRGQLFMDRVEARVRLAPCRS